MYEAWYHVLPNMRMPRSGGWKMAVNGIFIPPEPTPGMNRWRDEIRAHAAA
jgi:hypothetical protein